MRVRQCRLSGRRVPGSGFWCVAIGLEPILRFSISIMPALLAMPVDALLYPSNPQAGIELHHNGQSTEHFAPTPCCCVGWVMSPSRQCSFLLCRYEKAQGVNLGLEFFVSTIKAMATISDLHEIYAFQSSFARLLSKFVAFCCERDRVTCNKAPLSRRRKIRLISTQRSVNVSDQFFGVTPTSSASS